MAIPLTARWLDNCDREARFAVVYQVSARNQPEDGMSILCVLGQDAYGKPERGEGYEHANFRPALRSLRHDVELFASLDRGGYTDFADRNRRLVEHVATFRPDVILAVLMHYEVWTETLDVQRRESGAVVAHWETHDCWKFQKFSRFIACHVDLHVTASHAAAAEARRLGLDNVPLSQWAATSGRLNLPVAAEQCRYGCSFVGAAYGTRRQLVSALEADGIMVDCFGHGWPAGPVASEQVTEIFRTSKISLKFADSGLRRSGHKPNRSRQIKARTFEVPGAGGVLLTEPTLGAYFDVGCEIVTFEGKAELCAQVRALSADDARRDRVAAAGHERVLSAHTYEHRFAEIFDHIEPIRLQRQSHAGSLTTGVISANIEQRRRLSLPLLLLTSTRDVLDRFPRGVRAKRALRWITFELFWRVVGALTYSARGLPGRAFYDES